MKTYRFTYRMETFIQAPSESAARDLFEAEDDDEAREECHGNW